VALRRADGIVLRTRPFSESDLIVDLFYEGWGRRALIVKGARGRRSPMGGVFDALNQVEVVFYEKPNLDLASQAALVQGFARLKTDLTAVTATLGISRMLDRMLPLHQCEDRPYTLFRALLGALDADPENAEVLCLAAQLKLLAMLGHRPQLAACSSCGGRRAPYAFSSEEGGLLCARCAAGEGAISAGLARALERLLGLPLGRARMIRVAERDVRIAQAAIDGFVDHVVHGG
jgi:DNA repair protein RecO (recombination protein O)